MQGIALDIFRRSRLPFNARQFSAWSFFGGKTTTDNGDKEDSAESKRTDGPKFKLASLLDRADKPLTSAELWEQASNEGIKSKRFMKQMLQQLKQSGRIKTRPLLALKKQKESEFFKGLKAAAAEGGFFLMAGPNVIQSEEHCLKMCRQIKSVTDSLGIKLVFKSSFDKANRTNISSFRGPGMEEGLRVLQKVKDTFNVPIITDIHEPYQAEIVARVADIIQIPAFLCRQTDLLVAAAKTGKVIQIKKGQFCAPSVMRNSAEKCRAAGNPNVLVCERGTMFGYSDLIVDPRNFVFMRDAGCPITADVTHALQQPAGRALEGGGVASGGLREMIPAIARTAVVVGCDGLFMEVHDHPDSSPVDAPTQWPLRHLRKLLVELQALARTSRGKEDYPLDLSPVGEDFDPKVVI